MKKSNQYNLFEGSSNSTTNNDEIVLTQLQSSSQDSKQENKLKSQINKRLKRISKLEDLLKKDEKIIAEIKILFKDNLEDKVLDYNKRIENFVDLLIKRYEQKSFSHSQKEVLEFLITSHFNDLTLMGYQSEKLVSLQEQFEALHEQELDKRFGIEDDYSEIDIEDDVDDENEFETEIAEDILKEMLGSMGLEVDESFFEDLNINDANFHAKFQERIQDYLHQKEHEERGDNQRNKTVNTNKDFTKLYKSLVKQVHPDLTTNPEEKQRRETLMKTLTDIWEQRNYYDLLVFQTKIQQESEKAFVLEENHLDELADLLLQKIRDLEVQRYNYKNENEFYFNNFFSVSRNKIKQNFKKFEMSLQDDIIKLEDDISQLKNQKTTKSFLSKIKHEQMLSLAFSHLSFDDVFY